MCATHYKSDIIYILHLFWKTSTSFTTKKRSNNDPLPFQQLIMAIFYSLHEKLSDLCSSPKKQLTFECVFLSSLTPDFFLCPHHPHLRRLNLFEKVIPTFNRHISKLVNSTTLSSSISALHWMRQYPLILADWCMTIAIIDFFSFCT